MTPSQGDVGLNVQQEVLLDSYSGMATPSRAKFLVHVESVEQLIASLDWAHSRSLEWRVLGEGSNTVFIHDYPGLIIVVRTRGIQIESESSSQVDIAVAAGESWHQLVEQCVKNGWYGLENLALIPGLVGAAPIQNIGAYGVELEQFVTSVEYYDVDQQKLCKLNKQDCRFAYRDSVFKNKLAGHAVITQLHLTLSKLPAVNLSYAALADAFKGGAFKGGAFKGGTPTPEQVFDAVCVIRRQKLPLPADTPNCGSFFKNPKVSNKEFKQLRGRFPDLVGFVSNDGYKLAAGWLIEKAGWKKKQYHSVKVHQNQALVIINPDRAQGVYVAEFAKQIQRDIEQRFGVELEVEPNLI